VIVRIAYPPRPKLRAWSNQARVFSGNAKLSGGELTGNRGPDQTTAWSNVSTLAEEGEDKWIWKERKAEASAGIQNKSAKELYASRKDMREVKNKKILAPAKMRRCANTQG